MRFRTIRPAVLSETNGLCANPWCNRDAVDAHHIIHRQENGADRFENLIALCRQCHVAYHRGVIGRRTIRAWKKALSDGEARALGVHLLNWHSLDRSKKQRLWRAFRIGRIGGISPMCLGQLESAVEPTQILSYAVPLANAYRLRGALDLWGSLVPIIEKAILAMAQRHGEKFGLAWSVKLAMLKARMERALGHHGVAVGHFREAGEIAKADAHVGWLGTCATALAEGVISELDHGIPMLDKLDELTFLRASVIEASHKRILPSRIANANLLGKIAVARAQSLGGAGGPEAVRRLLMPAIVEMKNVRYVRGFSLRSINLADLLGTMLPSNSRRRDEVTSQMRKLYVDAYDEATMSGRIPIEESVIASQARHLRRSHPELSSSGWIAVSPSKRSWDESLILPSASVASDIEALAVL